MFNTFTKTTPKFKKAKSKAYNITLDFDAVEKAKKNRPDTSFSQYLSDLIKKDLILEEKVKTFSQIFGEDFKQTKFESATEEEEFYKSIGLKNYELHSKK